MDTVYDETWGSQTLDPEGPITDPEFTWTGKRARHLRGAAAEIFLVGDQEAGWKSLRAKRERETSARDDCHGGHLLWFYGVPKTAREDQSHISTSTP